MREQCYGYVGVAHLKCPFYILISARPGSIIFALTSPVDARLITRIVSPTLPVCLASAEVCKTTFPHLTTRDIVSPCLIAAGNVTSFDVITAPGFMVLRATKS